MEEEKNNLGLEKLFLFVSIGEILMRISLVLVTSHICIIYHSALRTVRYYVHYHVTICDFIKYKIKKKKRKKEEGQKRRKTTTLIMPLSVTSKLEGHPAATENIIVNTRAK